MGTTAKPRLAIIQEHPTTYHARFYTHLAADGRLDVEVLYLTNRGTTPFRNRGGTRIEYPKSFLEGYEWRELRNRSPFPNSFTFLDNVAPVLYDEIHRSSYDAVWVNGYNYASHWLAFDACVRRGVPIILRGESEDFFPRPLMTRIAKRVLLTPLFRRVSAFLHICAYNKEFYQSYGVPDEKLFFVPYALDNRLYQSPEQGTWRASIRQELGLNDDTVVFLFASQHRTAKRPRDAVEAFCRTSPRQNSALIMLGDGHLRRETEEWYRRQGGDHRVHFLGMKPFDEMRKYFAAADVLLVPSIENLGGPLVEGMAAGIAMISSDCVVAWRDYIDPGVNGLVYRSESIIGLASCIESLIRHPERAREMRCAATARSGDFSFERATDSLVAAVNYATGR